MKLLLSQKNITQENIPEGFDFIQVKDETILEELSKIPTNGCENLICDSALEGVAYQNFQQVFAAIASKVRSEGFMQIIGVDIDSVCEKVVNGEISIEEFNALKVNTKTLLNATTITSLLKNFGLDLLQTSKQHMFYKIVCKYEKTK